MLRAQHTLCIGHCWSFGLAILTVLLLAGPPRTAEAHERAPQPAGVCKGFVILSNGFAVLSGLHVPGTPGYGGAHQHGAPQAEGASPARGPMAGAAQHLMGHTHGQEVVPQAGMLCVPVAPANHTTWKAVSQAMAPEVSVTSLRGALTHGNQAPAAFALTVQQDGAPVEPTSVRLLVRMPHHDRRMAGGHGPANDPDVQGIAAVRDEQGRYTIPTVDFTMGGPWLFELQVQEGLEMRKTYFATSIGAE